MTTLINQSKNMLIGLFVIIALFIMVAIILFIKPSIGDGKQILKVYFSNINGINIGTRVTYAGKAIGEVSDIKQIMQARYKSIDHSGIVYPYVLLLQIDSSYIIYSTDTINVQTQGLLGEKYVSIIPKQITIGKKTTIVTSKDIIYADSNDLLDNTMSKVSILSVKIGDAVDKLILWVSDYGDSLGSAIKSFDKTITELGIMVKEINEQNIVDSTKQMTDNIASSFKQIDQIIYEIKERALFSNISKTFKNVESITSKINLGKGTLGQIIEENGLYMQIQALMTKANTVFDDINQYGVMFQYNKEWQRRRVKLMVEANRIRDPKAFQMYMNMEMNQINTTLSRMNRLSNRFSLEDLANNKKFRGDFTYLMQQLSDLQQRIELYNEEINQIRIQHN